MHKCASLSSSTPLIVIRLWQYELWVFVRVPSVLKFVLFPKKKKKSFFPQDALNSDKLCFLANVIIVRGGLKIISGSIII